MSTKKIYYENAYARECDAAVLECNSVKDRYEIVLDQTVFYPEGGGQPGDTGSLNDIPVFDTHARDDVICHYTRSPIQPGTEVHAVIDWERRFDYMQQHSGEHMISGTIHERFGLDNVGFHMGAEMTTIDFSGELSWKELIETEEIVNRMIWRNQPVKIWYPTDEELRETPYRSKKEIKEAVRLVEFPQADICACCGTHVSYTGEIGLVKIISCEKFHAGVRVEILCGKRAADYLCSVFEQNRQISQKLSSKPLETAAAVESLSIDFNEKRQRIYYLEEKLFKNIAESNAGAGDVLIFIDDLTSDGVRRACDAIQNTCQGRCAVFSGTDEEGYKYAIGLPGGNLQEFVKKMNACLNGRGGGKPNFVQGNVKSTSKEIREYFDVFAC